MGVRERIRCMEDVGSGWLIHFCISPAGVGIEWCIEYILLEEMKGEIWSMASLVVQGMGDRAAAAWKQNLCGRKSGVEEGEGEGAGEGERGKGKGGEKKRKGRRGRGRGAPYSVSQRLANASQHQISSLYVANPSQHLEPTQPTLANTSQHLEPTQPTLSQH